METVVNQVLNYSILGVSIGTLLALAIYVFKYILKSKKEIAITKESIKEGFKEVVLPKDLRINLSNKIDPAIKEAIKTYMEPMLKDFEKVMMQNQLMLSIMSKFTHADKLTQEEQNLLHDLLKDMGTEEVDL